MTEEELDGLRVVLRDKQNALIEAQDEREQDRLDGKFGPTRKSIYDDAIRRAKEAVDQAQMNVNAAEIELNKTGKPFNVPLQDYNDMRNAMENPTVKRLAEHLQRLKETSYRHELDWEETMQKLDAKIEELPSLNIYEVINQLIGELDD